MPLHSTTFEFLKPSDEQTNTMATLRQAARDYATIVEAMMPDGADKTYVLRRIRETAMWVNVAVTREADGTPRNRHPVGD